MPVLIEPTPTGARYTARAPLLVKFIAVLLGILGLGIPLAVPVADRLTCDATRTCTYTKLHGVERLPVSETFAPGELRGAELRRTRTKNGSSSRAALDLGDRSLLLQNTGTPGDDVDAITRWLAQGGELEVVHEIPTPVYGVLLVVPLFLFGLAGWTTVPRRAELDTSRNVLHAQGSLLPLSAPTPVRLSDISGLHAERYGRRGSFGKIVADTPTGSVLVLNNILPPKAAAAVVADLNARIAAGV